jgi:hypothetical protein
VQASVGKAMKKFWLVPTSLIEVPSLEIVALTTQRVKNIINQKKK